MSAPDDRASIDAAFVAALGSALEHLESARVDVAHAIEDIYVLSTHNGDRTFDHVLVNSARTASLHAKHAIEGSLFHLRHRATRDAELHKKE